MTALLMKGGGEAELAAVSRGTGRRRQLAARTSKIIEMEQMRASVGSTCVLKPRCAARGGPTRRGHFGFRHCALRSDRPKSYRPPSGWPGRALFDLFGEASSSPAATF